MQFHTTAQVMINDYSTHQLFYFLIKVLGCFWKVAFGIRLWYLDSLSFNLQCTWKIFFFHLWNICIRKPDFGVWSLVFLVTGCPSESRGYVCFRIQHSNYTSMANNTVTGVSFVVFYFTLCFIIRQSCIAYVEKVGWKRTTQKCRRYFCCLELQQTHRASKAKLIETKEAHYLLNDQNKAINLILCLLFTFIYIAIRCLLFIVCCCSLL